VRGTYLEGAADGVNVAESRHAHEIFHGEFSSHDLTHVGQEGEVAGQKMTVVVGSEDAAWEQRYSSMMTLNWMQSLANSYISLPMSCRILLEKMNWLGWSRMR
jgi:hypothetical protein